MFTTGIGSRKSLWIAGLVLLLTAALIVRSDPAAGGIDPPGEGIDLVYITTGVNFPDALGVGPGAALNGAPIILVPTNPPLDPATTAELERLDPQAVTIIGGTAAVSQATQDALEALLPNADFSRLQGTNRYVTNTLLTQSVFPVEAWASVGAAEFVGTSNSDAVIYGAIGRSVQNDTNGQLLGSIQLPDGASVLEFEFSGYDNHTDDVTVSLVRVTALGQIETLASGTSNGTPTYFTILDLPITEDAERVDNATYTYGISVTGTAGGSNAFYGARVRYRLGAP